MKIPYLSLGQVNQKYEPEIRHKIDDILNGDCYLFGIHLGEFEECFAGYCETSDCIGVANGSDALKLILMGYKELGELQDGEEVIVLAIRLLPRCWWWKIPG